MYTFKTTVVSFGLGTIHLKSSLEGKFEGKSQSSWLTWQINSVEDVLWKAKIDGFPGKSIGIQQLSKLSAQVRKQPT